MTCKGIFTRQGMLLQQERGLTTQGRPTMDSFTIKRKLEMSRQTIKEHQVVRGRETRGVGADTALVPLEMLCPSGTATEQLSWGSTL